MLPINVAAHRTPKLGAAAARAVAAGAIVFVLLVSVDQLSVHFGFTGVERLGDNLLGGIIVAIISFLDERRRQRYLADRLRVIALMNHHVRNSLQTIMFVQNTEHQVESLRDAVLRIEWALREILPGALNSSELRAQGEQINSYVLHSLSNPRK